MPLDKYYCFLLRGASRYWKDAPAEGITQNAFLFFKPGRPEMFKKDHEADTASS
jgi:hypothetical protein